MIAPIVPSARFAQTTSRNVAVHDSARVFTDAEWDQALSRAAAVNRDREAAPASTAVNTEVPPEGRVFADSVWDEAITNAPLLLKELDRVEEIARAPESVEGVSMEAGDSDRVFSSAQWDAAIQIAIATEKALAEKVCCSRIT